MSSKTTNLGLTKPAEDEFYDVDVQNKNMDKIDAEIGGLENPSYEEADKTAKLVSGEKFTIAFGKIAKAISTLIGHISEKATSSVLGHVKLSDSTSSTSAASAGVAATPKAVKSAYDLANENSGKIGTTDISGIGDGTLTGAVDALNQSKVGTDILGDIKEVYSDIVTTSKNVALDPNSAYLFVSWQNVSLKVNQPCEILLLTGTSTITQVTLYGTPLNIWKMLPTSGLTQGLYAKDGYYNYAKIIKL